eukprot:COSAG06_NODE_5165_length_3667_cov_7.140975_1_plen_55_part_00
MGALLHCAPPPPAAVAAHEMTSTNGMFAIVYGPASPPDGTSPEDYEAAEAVRRE